MRFFLLMLVFAVMLAVAGCASVGRGPAELRPRDLAVSGVAVGDDTAAVRRRLGPPTSIQRDAWLYPDLDVALDSGRVRILFITGPSRATARRLTVGDPGSRAAALYRPCYADTTLVQICYSGDFDERAVIAEVTAGHITRISVGRILEP